jgi:hypothetical protein
MSCLLTYLLIWSVVPVLSSTVVYTEVRVHSTRFKESHWKSTNNSDNRIATDKKDSIKTLSNILKWNFSSCMMVDRVTDQTTTAKNKNHSFYPRIVSVLPDWTFCVNGLQLLDQISTCRGLVQHTTADTDSKVSSAPIPTIYVDSSCGLSILNIQNWVSLAVKILESVVMVHQQ